MALTPEEKKIRSKEAKIGREAAQMATLHMQSRIHQKFKVKNKGGLFNDKPIKPMLEASKVKPKMGEYVLLGLDATSNKYAFMHHYGFKEKRGAASLFLRHPRWRINGFNRKPHFLKMPERSIFDKLYQKSGAEDFLIKELTKTRGESFTSKFEALINKFRSDVQES